MSDLRRVQRLAQLIRGELAKVLIEDISDPVLKNVVITDVELSRDLMHAKAFFTTQGDVSAKEEKEINKGLKRATGFFRKKLGENIEMRFTPQLEFERDKHGEKVSRLLGLFDEVQGSKA